MSDIPDTGGGGAIVHLVPSLVPGVCGVGDYAVRVATGLQARGIPSAFVACGTELIDRADENDPLGPFPTVTLTTNLGASLAAHLDACRAGTVMLHYTGNGYDPFGSPTWLANVLRDHARSRETRIVTFFHEVWQEPSLFSRRLYRTWFQRRVIRQICAASDYIVSNTQERVAALSPYHSRGCEYLPVFSNVGEAMYAESKDRGLAVIFGLPRRRQQTWDALARVPQVLEQLGIRRIVDIGPPAVAVPEPLTDIADVRGSLEADAVSALLAEASVGIILYNNAELGKSGILAAFAAHRLCVVNLEEAGRGTGDGDIAPGTHYLLPAQCAEPMLDPGRVAATLTGWYRPHSFDANIAALTRFVRT